MSGITAFSNICPADCTAVYTFPATDTDQNCNGAFNASEITDLWMRPNAAVDNYPYGTGVVADWGATTSTPIVANTVSSIDNADTTNTKVKWLTFVGDLPASDKTTQTGIKFTTITVRRTYTLTGVITNLSDAQYDFLKGLQCNPLSFTFWYANTAHFYGKDTGICPTFVDVDFPLTSGEDSIESATITIQWKAKGEPERRNNPYS